MPEPDEQAPQPHQPAAPLPPKRPRRLEHHGDVRIDDWWWLRDKEDPEVISYLEAENTFCEAESAPRKELEEALFSEILGRIKETDLSVPVPKGPWQYYTRTQEGLEYAIHCRRPFPGTEHEGEEGALDGEAPDETVLLDENALAAGSAFFALGGFSPSPDHRLIAWSCDRNGSERYELRVKDTQTGFDLPDVVSDTYYGLAWSADSRCVFYTRPDASMRPYVVMRHVLGTPPEQDVVVYEEPDESFYVGLSTTKDERFILVEMESKMTSEVRVVDAATPEKPPTLIEPRRHGVEYSVEHWGGSWLMVTNDGAENFRLVSSPVDALGEAGTGGRQWSEVLPYDSAVKLDGIDVMRSNLVLYERFAGVRRLRVADLAPGARVVEGSLVEIPQPEAVSSAWGSGNAEFNTSTLRYEYTSLVTPRTVYDYDIPTRKAVLRKRQEVLGGFDPSDYKSWRCWARAEDGTEVPISLVARADVEPDGSAPCLLYGYGAYEHSVDPTFSALRLLLLDRGVVFAIAHVRGGGEMGRRWYEEGRLLHKRNTFTDFVCAARHVVDSGWAAPGRLVARGGSAGGLLMGAVANMAPELFAGIVAEVPFVDCLTTILDESLPLTVLEWEEWGNPLADPETYGYMKSYSPYDNVRDVTYPRILATAGLEDPRVGFWEPAKWVAKLRSTSPETSVILKTEMGAGHMGPSGRYQAWRDEAFVLAFVADVLGLRGSQLRSKAGVQAAEDVKERS